MAIPLVLFEIADDLLKLATEAKERANAAQTQSEEEAQKHYEAVKAQLDEIHRKHQ